MRTNYFTILFLVLFSFGAFGQSIFRTACRGDISRLDSLLQHNDINSQDELGRSLLHWAVACRKPKAVDFLVDRGIKLNTEDTQGATPLFMAVRYNSPELLDKLIELQPNKDWIERYGPSLMERAILNKDLSIVKRLVEKGLNVNAVNKRGSSPLEIAQKTFVNEIVEWLVSVGADQSKVRNFNLKGPYMGQKAPGSTRAVFAPNFISIEEYEFGSVFNKAGTEFFYGVDVNGKPEIRYSKLVNNHWTQPVVVLSHERYGYNDPFLSPDENRLYFISQRALDGKGAPKKDHDIWYVERTKDGWSEPINAGKNINSKGNEYYISFTNDGTMYFSSNKSSVEGSDNTGQDIQYSKFINGQFQKSVALGKSVNTPAYEADVFVDPAEKYIIFCSTRSDGLGRGDLYISFKNNDGSWTESINMGETINTRHHELCPFVTADGKYLFYTSNEDIYWVSTQIIDELRKTAK